MIDNIETYYDKMSDDEKTDDAIEYFSIGQDEETYRNNYCWIWNGNDVIAKKGGTHGSNFTDKVADRNFKGWYDVDKNMISIVFPSYELRKLGERRPTEDDIPQLLYQKLINKFGKRKPKMVVFENLDSKDVFGNSCHGNKWWMDPNGKTYQIDQYQHHARWIFHNTDIDSYEEAFKRGWIRLVFVNIPNDKRLWYDSHKHFISDKKLKLIKDFAIELGCNSLGNDNTNAHTITSIDENKLLTESFNLPSDMDEECDRLAEYIASFFLPYFETRISHVKTKSDDTIVKYNEYYRLAKQFRSRNKGHFQTRKKNEYTSFGPSDFVIATADQKLPLVYLKFTNGYDTSTDGRLDVETFNIYIIIDKIQFIKSFKESLEDLKETIKHEVRHYIQLSNKEEMNINKFYGQPKDKVLSTSHDFLGYRKGSSMLLRRSHELTDVEFKTNLYTYSHYIKWYLNKRFDKPSWLKAFKDMMMGNYPTTGNHALDGIIDRMKNMMIADPKRWKQFVKEMYKLIFVNDKNNIKETNDDLDDDYVEENKTLTKSELRKTLKEVINEEYELLSKKYKKQNESMFPKEFNRHAKGSCMAAAALATDYLLSKGRTDFTVVEGWVGFGEEGKDWEVTRSKGVLKTYGDICSHTWIQFENGRIFDPTKKQWKKWGFNPEDAKIIRISHSYTPQEYQKICRREPDDLSKFKKEVNENYEGNEYWWMTPTMKFEKVGFQEHHVWAKKYLESIGKHREGIDVYKEMYKLGFIRVTKIGYFGNKILTYNYDNIYPLSPQKIKALKDWAIEHQCVRIRDDTGRNREEDLLQEIRLEPPVDTMNIDETMTYKELLDLTTPERKEKASNVRVRSIPVSVNENNEQWNFRYKSSPSTTVTNKPFQGSITFLKENMERNDDAMEIACKVDCSCPDFMYRFAYNDTRKGASQIGSKSLNKCINRSPKPAYNYGEGLCKHLAALRGYLQTKITSTKKSNLFEALHEVADQGPFNINYDDD